MASPISDDIDKAYAIRQVSLDKESKKTLTQLLWRSKNEKSTSTFHTSIKLTKDALTDWSGSPEEAYADQEKVDRGVDITFRVPILYSASDKRTETGTQRKFLAITTPPLRMGGWPGAKGLEPTEWSGELSWYELVAEQVSQISTKLVSVDSWKEVIQSLISRCTIL
ncbi:uncharacterized protein I303_105566 [Kwoniella dejecticola CBS 10117]|uniref:Uncharacterized protein n=1 Tax=Kwoniella dejecticola CBS 10117 TaxID=1296121 RepID=A0A1A6A279_9TREE|nr:uncharacterized protein I303_04991 [Kwoniella dejecticola CBS 10117]OBR84134.1 hypothetical protein I303_04991 [Kwoniella dejecticola CBS 10117]